MAREHRRFPIAGLGDDERERRLGLVEPRIEPAQLGVATAERNVAGPPPEVLVQEAVHRRGELIGYAGRRSEGCAEIRGGGHAP